MIKFCHLIKMKRKLIKMIDLNLILHKREVLRKANLENHKIAKIICKEKHNL